MWITQRANIYSASKYTHYIVICLLSCSLTFWISSSYGEHQREYIFGWLELWQGDGANGRRIGFWGSESTLSLESLGKTTNVVAICVFDESTVRGGLGGFGNKSSISSLRKEGLTFRILCVRL